MPPLLCMTSRLEMNCGTGSAGSWEWRNEPFRNYFMIMKGLLVRETLFIYLLILDGVVIAAMQEVREFGADGSIAVHG